MKSLWNGFAWWPMQARLVALATLAALPLVGLTLYEAGRAAKEVRANAEKSVAMHAERVTQELDQLTDKAGSLIAFLSTRREVQSLDVAACEDLFQNMVRIDPDFANAGYVAMDGRPICASVTQRGKLPETFADRSWFQRAVATDGLVVGDPVMGAVVARPTLGLATRIRSAGTGRAMGVLLVTIDLHGLSDSWSNLALPPGSVVAVQTADFKMLARHPAPEQWIGKDVKSFVQDFRAEHPSGPGLFTGPDGVRRLYAMQTSKLGWNTVVGISEAHLLATARSELEGGLVRLVAVILAAVLLAAVMARHMGRPIEALRRVAERATAGDKTVRASEDAPPELLPVVRQFNGMLDARAAAEEALRMEGELFRRLFTTVPVNVTVRAADDGTILNANERLLQTVGLPLESLIGKRLWDLGLGVAPEVEGPLLREVTHGSGHLRNAQLSVTGAGGKVFDLLINAERIEYQGRNAVLVASLDISSLNKVTLALQESEQQLAGIVESAMDAIVTVDANHRIRLFNAAAARMFALPADEAMGQPLSRLIPAANRKAHDAHVREFAGSDSRQPQRMAPRRDLRALRADGTEFPIEASISRTGEGLGMLLTAVVRDLTEVHEAQRAREQQLKTEVASKAKSDFVANVGHELRTPLNAVMGFVNLVVADTRRELDPEHRRFLEQARDGGWHLAGLIDDLLDLSRIEADQLRVQKTPVRVDEVIASAITLARPQADRRQVSLVAGDVGLDALFVLGDGARLRQVFINLLSNGAKYNRPGGKVKVSTHVAGGRIRIAVADDGVGMTQDQQERLFRRFDRLGRESGYIEGTGIGLALTKKLVEAMDGAISVTSAFGVGTTVTVELPSAVAAAPAPAAARTMVDPASPLRGKVLYIEDEPVNVLLVEAFMRGHPGVELQIAETGQQGLEMAALEAFDLVLLDRGLPDLDGMEVLARIRGMRDLGHVPVVMLSASAMEQDVTDCLAAGAAGYWTKPIDVERWASDLAVFLSRDGVLAAAPPGAVPV